MGNTKKSLQTVAKRASFTQHKHKH